MVKNSILKTVLSSFVILAGVPAVAQDEQLGEPTFSTQSGGFALGSYVRVEVGGLFSAPADAYWLPPGAPPNGIDPQINFDLSAADGAFGAVALGYDWQNGWRGDLSLSRTQSIGFSGPCASASNASPCLEHADITDGSLTTTAFMANVFYAPLEATGSNAAFQPFVVAGIGFANNRMGSWTRTANAGNQQAQEAVRVFNSNSNVDVAWSIGAGFSWQISGPRDRPVNLEATWRYYDFGTAVGGSQADVGNGIPVQPLTFENRAHVVTFGVRIPL